MPLLVRWIEGGRPEDYFPFESSEGTPLPSVSFDKPFGFVYEFLSGGEGEVWAPARLAFLGPRPRRRDDGICYLEPAEVRNAASGLRAMPRGSLEGALHAIIFMEDARERGAAAQARVKRLMEESYAICAAAIRQLEEFYEAAASRGSGVFIHVF